MNMPLRFQNVCRHRQTNNTDHFPPPLTPPHVVSSPFRRASFKLALPFPKIPGRPFSANPHTAHVVFSPFLPRFFQTCPTFPENPLPAVFRRSSHRTRCFLTFPAALLSNFPAFPENPRPAFSRHPAPHTLFSRFPAPLLSNLLYLSRKSPADRFPPPLTPPHVVSSPFPPRFFQTFPPFPKISCRPSSADPHTARVVSSLSGPVHRSPA